MTGLDLDRVLREIDDEVRTRRAAGDFPASMDRELDLVFARLAPAGGDDGLGGFLDATERLAFMDVEVPTESQKPGVAPVKRGLRTLMQWYLRYLAQQVSAYASSSTTALRMLATRVVALEEASRGASARVIDERRHVGPTVDPGPFADLVSGHLAASEGRVLLAECGDGSLVRRLVDAGVDAYGLDPAGAVELGLGGSLELVQDDAVTHLRGLADGVLGGLLLLGAVDRLPLGGQLELVDRAADVLAEGGRVVVVTATPEAWSRAVDPVDADLAPGRPLHAATWAHLLAERGFIDVTVHDGPRTGALEPVDGQGGGADTLNANLARISEALFPPRSAAVTATRARPRAS